MFLTRFQVNPSRRASRKLLSSPHAMHAAVLSAFASPSAGTSEGRVLWRLDQHNPHRVLLYVVSPREPDLTHLVEQVGWPTTESWETRPYDKFLDSLARGQRWAFRLTANPTRNGKPPGAEESTSTRRFGHVTPEQQRAWLLTRCEAAGFRITEGVAGEPDLVVRSSSTFAFPRNGQTVTLRVASFDGRLEVDDPDALRRILALGLGHAKAYGCGLMTLAALK
ncbi:MAG: type I-E CRISPR-associated protein Cas6/Cse3/CasE [Coriobacteriia bacterium]|nr:type I-E CRISPR-associated protein Cas6/Cse3/CasE [Coriobacteriia bacterium]